MFIFGQETKHQRKDAATKLIYDEIINDGVIEKSHYIYI